jgi:hypothetical protein
MQVFISYSHSPRDKALAEVLSTALRAAGLAPWRDEEKLPPGQRLDTNLSAAIEASQAGIFLISNSWLESKHCRWELDQFGERNRAARRIGILRQPRTDIAPRLGPDIFDLTHLDWQDDGRSSDERFWKLYCGLTATEPGPASEWAARGAQISRGAFATIQTTLPAVPAAPSFSPALSQGPYGSPSLTCDRHKHWGTIVTHARLTRHEILALVGPRKFGHRRLMARIALELTDPPRVARTVTWGVQPQTQPDLLELVFSALTEGRAPAGDVETHVVGELRRLLATTNVVLLFPPLVGRFAESPLVELFTKTLPRLLAAEPTRHHVKCVLPIEWLPAPAVKRVLWTVASLFADPPEDDDREPAARKFLAMLKQHAAPAMPLTILPVLDEVPSDELTTFLETLDLTPGQRQALLERVMELGTTPDDMFDAIDQYYDEFRGRRL